MNTTATASALSVLLLGGASCGGGDEEATSNEPQVQFEADREADEGVGSVDVEVSLGAPATQDVTIPFTIDGDDADFTATASPLTIPQGETTASLSVEITDDTLDEDEEVLLITFGEPQGPARLGEATSATLRILDNDAQPTVGVGQAALSASEDESSASIDLMLDSPSGRDVVVELTLGGSATRDVDYSVAETSVRIPAGELQAALLITLLDDEDTEGEETVSVTIASASNGTLGAATVAQLTLRDDETPTASADVVFIASLTSGARALLSVREAQAAPVVLVEPQLAGAEVERFVCSPDGTQVALVGDLDTDNVFELYSVPVDGSAPHTKISAPMTNGGDVFAKSDVLWSPDGQFVAYVADQLLNGKLELFVARADGAAPPVNVSSSLINGGTVRVYAWSPVANRLVFQSDKITNSEVELFAVDADGSNDVRLNEDLVKPMEIDVAQFAWAPDGSRIAYIARQDSNNNELFTVTPSGQENLRVSGTMQANGAVTEFKWSPDSSTIGFLADRATNGSFELFTAAPTSVDTVEISDLPALQGRDVKVFEWSPDSQRLAYTADQDAGDVVELFAAAKDGSGLAQVNPALVNNGDVSEFHWAPDSLSLGYVADQVVNNLSELFVAEPDGSSFVKVSGAMVAGGGLDSASANDQFGWLPDSSRVVYGARQDSLTATELYSSLADGTDNQKLTGPMETGEANAMRTSLASNGRLVYVTTQEIVDRFELFSTTTDSNSDVRKLSGADVSGAGVDPDQFDAKELATRDSDALLGVERGPVGEDWAPRLWAPTEGPSPGKPFGLFGVPRLSVGPRSPRPGSGVGLQWREGGDPPATTTAAPLRHGSIQVYARRSGARPAPRQRLPARE